MHVCMYVCMYVLVPTTFLDAVLNLCTEAFLTFLRCSTALYGVPTEIHSNNGTNFVGADKELKRIYKTMKHKLPLTSGQLQLDITPGPSFWGALHVKSMKTCICKVVGEQTLLADELMYEAANMQNSHPHTSIEIHSAEGLIPLTPGHFLIGGPLISLLTRQEPTSKSAYGSSFSA